ncbi:hypothetical protein Ciccas_005110 [Cichlidogyrus casuarinus]|uniref:EGF-like domain-containing protein n=1 Tax=Cichlidogyrus casuarinus TaxID=1844966 RepID=A0ABD2Q9N7_9PLAT
MLFQVASLLLTLWLMACDDNSTHLDEALDVHGRHECWELPEGACGVGNCVIVNVTESIRIAPTNFSEWCGCYSSKQLSYQIYEPLSAQQTSLFRPKCVKLQRADLVQDCDPENTIRVKYTDPKLPQGFICHCASGFSSSSKCKEQQDACSNVFSEFGQTTSGDEACKVEIGNLCVPTLEMRSIELSHLDQPGLLSMEKYQLLEQPTLESVQLVAYHSCPDPKLDEKKFCDTEICVGYLYPNGKGNGSECDSVKDVCICPEHFSGPHCLDFSLEMNASSLKGSAGCHPNCQDARRTLESRETIFMQGVSELYNTAYVYSAEDVKEFCHGVISNFQSCPVNEFCLTNELQPYQLRALALAQQAHDEVCHK